MAPEPRDPIRVFVVDDHAVVRRGLRAFLETEPDLEVVGAADGGTQALDLLEGLDAEGRRPDVVVMDLQMRAPGRHRVDPPDPRPLRRRGGRRADLLRRGGARARARSRPERRGTSSRTPMPTRSRPPCAPRIAASCSSTRRSPGVCSRRWALLRAARPRRTSRRASSRSCGWWGRARRTRRSPSQLGISERTARTHVSNILGKLGLASRTQAALWAVREGLVPVDGG